MLPDEFDAEGFAAAPDYFAASPGPGIARERQPHLRRHRMRIVDSELGAGGGQIEDGARTRGEAAIERDPSGLADRFAGFPLCGDCHLLRLPFWPPLLLPGPALESVATSCKI